MRTGENVERKRWETRVRRGSEERRSGHVGRNNMRASIVKIEGQVSEEGRNGTKGGGREDMRRDEKCEGEVKDKKCKQGTRMQRGLRMKHTYSVYIVCCTQSENLRNLEIALHILRIPRLHSNLEIVQLQCAIFRLRKLRMHTIYS